MLVKSGAGQIRDPGQLRGGRVAVGRGADAAYWSNNGQIRCWSNPERTLAHAVYWSNNGPSRVLVKQGLQARVLVKQRLQARVLVKRGLCASNQCAGQMRAVCIKPGRWSNVLAVGMAVLAPTCTAKGAAGRPRVETRPMLMGHIVRFDQYLR